MLRGSHGTGHEQDFGADSGDLEGQQSFRPGRRGLCRLPAAPAGRVYLGMCSQGVGVGWCPGRDDGLPFSAGQAQLRDHRVGASPIPGPWRACKRQAGPAHRPPGGHSPAAWVSYPGPVCARQCLGLCSHQGTPWGPQFRRQAGSKAGVFQVGNKPPRKRTRGGSAVGRGQI